MIVVSVFLRSAIHASRDRELARMVITNDGEQSLDDPRRGTYEATTYRGRDTAALDKGVPMKRASVGNWPRNDLHVWNLVHWFLTRMGYTQTRASVTPAGPVLEAVPQLAGYRRVSRDPYNPRATWVYTDTPDADHEWEPLYTFTNGE